MVKSYSPPWAPVPPLNPMSTFDPDKSSLVYDELNDQFIMWVPDKWAGEYREYGLPLDADGRSGWDGLILTGWLDNDAIEVHGPAVIPRLNWGEVVPFSGVKNSE